MASEAAQLAAALSLSVETDGLERSARRAAADVDDVSPSSPREMVVRFMERTGADADTACLCVNAACAGDVGLADAISRFVATGDVVLPPAPEIAAAARERRADPPPSPEPQPPAAKRARLEVPVGAVGGAVVRGGGAGGGGDILDGGEAYVGGGGGGRYRITRRGDIYACACPAWRNQRLGPYRTCKHIRELRGEEAERRRLVDAGHTTGLAPVRGAAAASSGGAPAAAAAAKNPGIEKGVMLAQRWEEGKVDPTGYLMSEKLDGMRAVWDGAALWTRTGNAIAAPAYFVAALPEGIKLDGELFIGRGRFEDVMSVCRSQVPNETSWRQVRYVVFDAPSAAGGIAERLASATGALGAAEGVARIHEQVVCRGASHVLEELARVLALEPPAEGLMLAAPGRAHRGGRCADILKVKKFVTDDAKVVGHKPGKGKHLGRLGALECVLRGGQRFDVGSGFSDAERDDYAARYPVGSVIEFRYFEITSHGVPRFPTFLRARPDVDASEFA